MNKPNLDDILRSYLSEALELDRLQHLNAPIGSAVYALSVPDGMDPVDQDTEVIDDLISAAREAVARRDIRVVMDDLKRLVSEHHVPKDDHVALGLGLLQARVQILETARHRALNGAVASIATAPQGAAVLSPASQPEAHETPNAPFLSAQLPSFLEFMSNEKGWRGQTLAQNSTTYQMFIEVCGDLPPRQYTRKHCTEFYDLLRGLPALYAKKAVWRDMRLLTIAEKSRDQKVERITLKTVKRHFSALGRLFSYFKRRGEYEGENPAHGFEFPQKGRANQKRQMWEGEKLSKLFNSPVWTGCMSEGRRTQPGTLIIRDDKYWLPLLGIFHGNRLEEFAQLRRSDIRREGDIWYFDINDEGTRQLKNAQSRRRVPVHPYMKQLGFLSYMEDIAKNASDLVFPDLRPGGPDNKLGYHFTKWFSRYRMDIGLYEKGLDYHSFRHSVITKLYAANVPEPLIDELTGHEGGGVGRQIYKKAMPLDQLSEAISRVEWPEITIQGCEC